MQQDLLLLTKQRMSKPYEHEFRRVVQRHAALGYRSAQRIEAMDAALAKALPREVKP